MKVPKPRKLPSGNWFIQMRLGGESVPVTEPTEKRCIKSAQLVKAEYLAGKRERSQQGSGGVPLGDAIDTYIEARSNTISPSTIRGYKIIRRNRFQGMMEKDIATVSDHEWIAACNSEAAECSAKTVTNSWRFIASVLRENKIEPPKVPLPQIPPNERAFLDPDQIKVFIKAVAGSDIEIPALLALSSLRRSEILALTWSNVDLKKRRILVRGSAVMNEKNKIVQKTENKNKSSTRYVPIMINGLYKALERNQGEGLVVSVHHDTLRKHINAVCAARGLPQVGIHGLRHSFASLAYHLGIPEKITMEIGGWSDSQTMRGIYTHVARSDVTRYETKLGEFFKSANKNANGA